MEMQRRFALALALLGLSSAAAGQVIFHDDFSGTALGPHWSTGNNPLTTSYVVGGGRLTVDWIQNPLGPPWISAYNAAFLASIPPHQGDFVATLRLGWEPGTHRTVSLNVLSAFPSTFLGVMTYSEQTGLLHGSLGSAGPTIPAPPPGIHEFEIARIGSEVHFSLNNQHFGSMPATSHAVSRIGLDVRFSYPGHSFQPVYFESITIVPSPGGGVALLGVGLWGLRHRRRR